MQSVSFHMPLLCFHGSAPIQSRKPDSIPMGGGGKSLVKFSCIYPPTTTCSVNLPAFTSEYDSIQNRPILAKMLYLGTWLLHLHYVDLLNRFNECDVIHRCGYHMIHHTLPLAPTQTMFTVSHKLLTMEHRYIWQLQAFDQTLPPMGVESGL